MSPIFYSASQLCHFNAALVLIFGVKVARDFLVDRCLENTSNNHQKRDFILDLVNAFEDRESQVFDSEHLARIIGYLHDDSQQQSDASTTLQYVINTLSEIGSNIDSVRLCDIYHVSLDNNTCDTIIVDIPVDRSRNLSTEISRMHQHRMRLSNVNRLVVFRFLRFVESGELDSSYTHCGVAFSKANNRFDFPDSLLMPLCNSSSSSSSCCYMENYSLSGVLVHSGLSASNGHFACFINNENQWERHNDNTTPQVIEDIDKVKRNEWFGGRLPGGKECSSCAYLVLYARK